jgi:hypothetical protein
VRIEENTFLVAGGGSGLGGSYSPHARRVVVADLVKHIIENEMLNGEVIRLDGAIRMAPS